MPLLFLSEPDFFVSRSTPKPKVILPFVKTTFFRLVQIRTQSMADLWQSGAQNPAIAIDTEFSAVKITRCLKTGGNTAGNPEQVSPVNNHTERPATSVADWSLCHLNVRSPSIGRSPQPSGGRLARRQPLFISVAEYPVRLSQEA